MDTMYYGDVLVVDLDAGKTEQVDFDELDEAGPGLPAGIALYNKYSDSDPLVLGSGLFTGTPVPGACLGFMIGKSPVTGELAVSPLSQFAGAEMKLSGFSAVVIKGAASKPVYLWLHDGVADIKDASSLRGLDTWQTTDTVRHDMGESLIQVISIGPAGEAATNLASYSINYWGSGDSAALGAVMGAKNLKAVALRGLGMLDAEEPADFYEQALELLGNATASRGFSGVCASLDADDIDEWLRPMIHRYRSCFACPSACATFVKYNEPASVMEPEGVEEPGMLVADAPAALWLKSGGWDAEPACRALEAMARAGVDLLRGARELSANPLDDPSAISAAVRELKGSEHAGWPSGEPLEYGLFGPWVPPLGSQDEWLAANRAGYVLGICPTLIMTGGIDTAALFQLCGSAAGLEMDSSSVDGMF
jgi:aldehyde:ferredoxin oxidoreductase